MRSMPFHCGRVSNALTLVSQARKPALVLSLGNVKAVFLPECMVLAWVTAVARVCGRLERPLTRAAMMEGEAEWEVDPKEPVVRIEQSSVISGMV